MSDFNTDDINDLILKDIAIEECRERIAELEEQNKRLVELLKTSVAEFDDGIKYPLEVVNDLKTVLRQHGENDEPV